MTSHVRQALAYAVNKPNLVQVQGGPLVAKPLGQIIISNQLGYEPFDPYATPDSAGDPEKARQLLADAGFPDGITLDAIYRPTALQEAVATTLKEDLAKAGITSNLHKLGPNEARGYVQSADNPWDISISNPGFAPDWQGPSTRMLLGGWLNSDAAPAAPATSTPSATATPSSTSSPRRPIPPTSPVRSGPRPTARVSTDLPWIPLFEIRKIVDHFRPPSQLDVVVARGQADITNVALKE